MKSIDTLVDDINEVILGRGGWDQAVNEFFKDTLGKVIFERLSEEQKPRDYIGLSQVGNPCKRELWYLLHSDKEPEPLSPEAIGTFMYGDILEAFAISLAIAAGHRVEGLQQPLDVFGIKGSGDCIIDGMVVDVKSASRFGFEKFKKNGVKEDDPFGYISQLSSYLYGYKDDPRVFYKDRAAFLVIQKDRFKLILDPYELSEELANKRQEIESVKKLHTMETPPDRMPDVEAGKSGNRKLGVKCSYCSRKFECWPKLRTFIYSTGPEYLTKVAKLPKVKEV